MSSGQTKHNNADFRLDSLYSVKDRVALVTGGGSGIGLMATQTLAVNGAKVYIVGRTAEKLQRVAETYGKDIDGQIIPMAGDCSKKESIRKLLSEFEQRESSLDILINNAGVSSAAFQFEAKTAAEMRANLFDNERATEADWLEPYQINVVQCYFMTLAFLPLLEKASQAHPDFTATVINMGSISGLMKVTQHHPSYNASKAATLHLTRMLAHEVASNHLPLRVNAIAPGPFPSEMTAGDSQDNQKSDIPEEKVENYKNKVPLGRPGMDKDMGNAVLYAVTNQYLTGETLVIDGGYALAAGK